MSTSRSYSLSEVTSSIQKTLGERYKTAFWVRAEMNKLNYYSHSGHCYPELVEKHNGKVVAQLKSTLWKKDHARINQRFIEVLKEPLKDGIKILFQAQITFDPIYGISLHILDIDPAFTLGDLEQEKKQTIDRLNNEGIFLQNKKIALPVLPQRIAIISVETSKGYADFLQVLEGNSWNYKFFHMLFPALLQGEKAIDSIIKQLERIKKVIHHFDVVAIIRGGGGDVGLSCYNNYNLAKQVALFPIPVLTGIGHATNETVVELVSHRNGITPTKVAEDLIQQFHQFAVPVNDAQKLIVNEAMAMISQAKSDMQSEVRIFRNATENLLQFNRQKISENQRTLSQQTAYTIATGNELLIQIGNDLRKDSKTLITNHNYNLLREVSELNHLTKSSFVSGLQFLKEEERALNNGVRHFIKDKATLLVQLEKDIKHMSPQEVMKRGYSITRVNGKALQHITEIKEGDQLTTTISDGVVQSTVIKLLKTQEK